VLGEHDRLVPRSSWDELSEQIPHAASHVVDGVGHYPQVENPALVVEILRNFFRSVDEA
jgi:pimeloyl-ACP methyl ester carboxylesterase